MLTEEERIDLAFDTVVNRGHNMTTHEFGWFKGGVQAAKNNRLADLHGGPSWSCILQPGDVEYEEMYPFWSMGYGEFERIYKGID